MLTQSEKKLKYQSIGERLLVGIHDAAKRGQSERQNALMNKLEGLVTNFEVPYSVRVSLMPALEEARLNALGFALDQMESVAQSLSGAMASISTARRVAESGKKELFFPALANEAETIVSTLETYLEAGESIIGQLNAIGDGNGLLGQLEAAHNAIANIRVAIDEFGAGD